MRISFNWLQQYIDIQESAEEIANILTSLGLEVESLERQGVSEKNLDKVVVAEVMECWKHPNADRLRLTKVDPGNGQCLQVVCGAPNVAAGQKVLLAMEGAVLHPVAGEPFEIKKGKIRGEISEGMLCAEDELGLGTSHEGIIVLDSKYTNGTAAFEIFKENTDVLFEIGLTPNRADATSHLGIAKDLLAWYRVHRDPHKSLKVFGLADLTQAQGSMDIKVTVEDLQGCPRYSGICLRNIVVQDSPEWLQRRIQSMGLQPVNNVVDVTNFIMYEMGQPLHAFDYEHIQHHHIIVKNLPEGTAFRTLDDVERKLKSKDLMICDGDQQPLCIAGVFGGKGSGVNPDTRSVFIESAYFDPGTVRRSSMSHNLRTQSAKCFEKGADPNNTLMALSRAVFLLQEISGAEIASRLVDLYPKSIMPAQIELPVEYAIHLSGLRIDKEALKRVLFALDMELEDHQNGNLRVFVPTNKPDVKRAADLVEEVCRIYGLDAIPVPETLKISFPKAVRAGYQVKRKISEWLSHAGLLEIMSLSLVRSGVCTKSGIWNEEELIYINNTSNIHLDAMKPSMCLGGLEALQYNANRQQTDLAFFELGKQYSRRDNRILEEEMLGIWLYGQKQNPHWSIGKAEPADFFQLKSVIVGLLEFFGIRNYRSTEFGNNPILEFGLEYSINGQTLLRFGKLKNALAAAFDLKKDVWFAEVFMGIFKTVTEQITSDYVEYSKFPLVKRDLALVLDQSVRYEEVEEYAKDTCGAQLKEIQLFDVYKNEEQLGPGKKSLAISLTFEHQDRQLTGEEMEAMMQTLIQVFGSKLGAVVRK